MNTIYAKETQTETHDLLFVVDELDNLRDGLKVLDCIETALAENGDEYFSRALFYLERSMEQKINMIEEAVDVIRKGSN